MTKRKKILVGICFLVVFIIVIILIIINTFKNNMLGNYYLIKMTENGTFIGLDDTRNFRILGYSADIEIRKDKTATLDFFGKTLKLTYDKEKMFSKDEEMPYTYEDGVLTLEKNGNTYVFEKVSEEEEESSD